MLYLPTYKLLAHHHPEPHDDRIQLPRTLQRPLRHNATSEGHVHFAAHLVALPDTSQRQLVQGKRPLCQVTPAATSPRDHPSAQIELPPGECVVASSPLGPPSALELRPLHSVHPQRDRPVVGSPQTWAFAKWLRLGVCRGATFTTTPLTSSWATKGFAHSMGSSMRCQRCTTWTTSCVTVSLEISRQHVESSWQRLWNSFPNNPWQRRSRSSFVSSDFLCQLPPFATACHTSRPNSSRPMHHSVSVSSNSCLVQPRSW